MRGCRQQKTNRERLRTEGPWSWEAAERYSRQLFVRGSRQEDLDHERLQTDTVDNYLWEAADRRTTVDDRYKKTGIHILHTPRLPFIWEADARRQRLQIWGQPLIRGCRQKDNQSWEAKNRRTIIHKRLLTKEQLLTRGCNLRFCEVVDTRIGSDGCWSWKRPCRLIPGSGYSSHLQPRLSGKEIRVNLGHFNDDILYLLYFPGFHSAIKTALHVHEH